MAVYKHIATAGNLAVAGANGGARLETVNVNTAAANATLTIYDGTDATGVVVAAIDASETCSRIYDVKCNRGIFAVLAVGNADVTIGHT